MLQKLCQFSSISAIKEYIHIYENRSTLQRVTLLVENCLEIF